MSAWLRYDEQSSGDGRDRTFQAGSHAPNLTTTKARLLLTGAIMKLGPLPHAADPDHPTTAELDSIKQKIALYQAIFQTH